MPRIIGLLATAIMVGGVGAPASSTPAPAKNNGASAAQTPQPLTRANLIKNIDGQFRAIDANGDGVLTQQELAAAEAKAQQARFAVIRARMEAEFNRLDTNHDGVLSKAEFMAAAPQAPPPPNGAALLAKLDKNHDGKVTLEEYRAPVLQQFDRLDTNHDGVLSPAERGAKAPHP